MLRTKLQFIWASCFRGEDFIRNQPIRNKNCLWWSSLLTDRDKMCNLYRGPSIDASFHVSVHLVKWFQRRIYFRNQLIRNKNYLWHPWLTHRDEMCNLYRGPSIDASYQVSVHMARRFQRRRIFRNQPTRKNNCLWLPCLLTDRDEMCKFDRGPTIDASYQALVHVAQPFQRRRFI